MAAGLKRLLARLAIDPQLLAEFIRKPEEFLANADLTNDEWQALTSRDQTRIQLCVMEQDGMRA